MKLHGQKIRPAENVFIMAEEGKKKCRNRPLWEGKIEDRGHEMSVLN